MVIRLQPECITAAAAAAAAASWLQDAVPRIPGAECNLGAAEFQAMTIQKYVYSAVYKFYTLGSGI
jgi:hypothetical protein